MAKRKAKQKSTKHRSGLWYGGGALLLIIIALGLYFGLAGNRAPAQASANSNSSNSKLAPAKGQVIDGIRCESSESLLFHIHPVLTIVIEGQERTVPANIGILPRCLYWLHTHRANGVIHIESPIQRDYTLGDFFDIWGQRLDSQHLLDKVADQGHSVRAFVDGQRYLGDPRQIVLKDREQIELMYGPPFPSP